MCRHRLEKQLGTVTHPDTTVNSQLRSFPSASVRLQVGRSVEAQELPNPCMDVYLYVWKMKQIDATRYIHSCC